MRVLVALLACGLLLAPATAAAQGPVPGSGDVLGQASARVDGELVVAFRSDPATCALVGRCGLEGTLAWQPARRLTLLPGPGRGAREVRAPLLPLGEGAPGTTRTTAQVRREGGATCTDAVDGLSDLVLRGRRGGPLALRLGEEADPLATRCGGPVLADVAGLLPAPAVTLAALRRAPARLDARVDAPFTAAGLTGTVRSTLQVRLGRLRPGSPLDDGGQGDRERRRVVRATYRVEQVGGSVTAAFTGSAPSALCAPLDACGASGELVLAPQHRGGTGEVRVSLAPRSRVRGLVAALRRVRGEAGERRAAQGFGYAEWTDRGRVVARVQRPEGTPCTDEAALRRGSVFLEPRGARVRLTLLSAAPVATRCAGPLFGVALGQPALATGSVPVAAFGRPRVTLRLTRGAVLEDGPYAGRSRSDLTVVLRRTGLTTRVVREPVG